ncbi:MAG: 50S ribosomal protein L24 [Gemmatimonadota bacterium]|jgi:large subunit ribosomal protein L24
MPRIVKGDEVLVISGNDRGRTGKVLAVFPKQRRVIVEGVNFIKRHTRPSQQNPQGGIVEREAPIHISNVLPYDAKAGRGTRVRTRELSDGTRVRESAASGEVLEKPRS